MSEPTHYKQKQKKSGDTIAENKHRKEEEKQKRFFLSPKKFSRKEMERAILGGGRSFQFNGRTLRGSAYRLHRRTCYTKKEPLRRISEVLKVAATCLFYACAKPSDWGVFGRFARSAIRGTPSPAQRGSAVPSAMLSLCPVLSLLPSPLSAPLLSALSRARAPQARTPHAPHRPPPQTPRAPQKQAWRCQTEIRPPGT